MVMGSLRMETEVAILGAGPGGYVAAIHAADLGRDVTLIEERDRYERWYEDERKEKLRLYRRVASLKGAITRLKKAKP